MKVVALLLFALLVSACSADQAAKDAACVQQRPANATGRWGYYPGYGCGVIPRQVSAPFG
jgi:hypothetical protein